MVDGGEVDGGEVDGKWTDTEIKRRQQPLTILVLIFG